MVCIGGQQSDPFKVEFGVNQGCVLALVIFNMFLLFVTLRAHEHLGEDSGIELRSKSPPEEQRGGHRNTSAPLGHPLLPRLTSAPPAENHAGPALAFAAICDDMTVRLHS
ncbi:hypothetical protein SKAU_G00114350 [Synaphobranchus kaupii]|uniref:Uncharacterized protein n=1 Tax=Synaphobranchus kaupii TaxID=118154 RepID=A0A9Q1G1Q5_SYNKA|nr:hypothetical protein SKAU_G00114350 [Synaphobranchus kaupii]